MKRCALVLPILLLILTAGVRADVTITNVMTFTGPMAAMMGGSPQVVMRVKGTRARMDMEMANQKISSIIDINAKTITTLTHAQKTAQVADVAAMMSNTAPQLPPMDAKVEPTGKTQEIKGQNCAEYRYSMAMDMAGMASMGGRGAGDPQQAAAMAEMMKGLKLIVSGSMWVAKEGPGVAEYVEFSKAAQKNMIPLSPLGGAGIPGAPGMQDLMRAFTQLDGVTYQSDLESSFEGDNPMIEMMKTMGAMKISIKLTDISTEAIGDDLFQVPSDYTVTKQ